MKDLQSIGILLLIISGLVLIACEKEEFGEPSDMKSTSLSSESHHNGDNCMNCHKSGGSGEGWFTVAGSVYNSTQTVPYITATIELRTGQLGAGNLVATIDVDQNGNFYTTETVDFGNGLYALVKGGTATNYMTQKITTGACNSCHDSSNKLWTE